jgi:hypothetical protein
MREVRHYAATQLPGYLVPAAIEAIDELPLTGNGKVDRAHLAELPWPESETPLPAAAVRGRPRPVAAFTAEMVAAELGLRSAPGLEDDLLQLGADSLAMVRIGKRLRERFGFAPSLVQTFADPTVSGIAAVLERHLMDNFRPNRNDDRPVEALPSPTRDTVATDPRGVEANVDLVGRQGWFPLAPAQAHLYIQERLAPGRAGLNIPAVVRFLGELDETALRRALKALVQRHDALRMVFDIQEATAMQRACPDPDVQL